MNPRIVTPAVVLLLLTACSSTANLDQVGMCKALVESARGAVSFDSAVADGSGYDDLAVKITFTDASGADGSATCYYENTVQDAGPDELVDPLSMYATSPHRMQLNGRTVSNQNLVSWTNGVMRRAGEELAEGAEKAAREAGEAAQQAARKAGEAAKNAAKEVSRTLNEPAI